MPIRQRVRVEVRTAHLDPVHALQHALDRAMPQQHPVVAGGADSQPVTISWDRSSGADASGEVATLFRRLRCEVLGDPEAEFSRPAPSG